MAFPPGGGRGHGGTLRLKTSILAFGIAILLLLPISVKAGTGDDTRPITCGAGRDSGSSGRVSSVVWAFEYFTAECIIGRGDPDKAPALSITAFMDVEYCNALWCETLGQDVADHEPVAPRPHLQQVDEACRNPIVAIVAGPECTGFQWGEDLAGVKPYSWTFHGYVSASCDQPGCHHMGAVVSRSEFVIELPVGQGYVLQSFANCVRTDALEDVYRLVCEHVFSDPPIAGYAPPEAFVEDAKERKCGDLGLPACT